MALGGLGTTLGGVATAAALDALRTVIHPRGLGLPSRPTIRDEEQSPIPRIRTSAYMLAWRAPAAGGVRWSAGGWWLTSAAVTTRVRGLAGADV